MILAFASLRKSSLKLVVQKFCRLYIIELFYLYLQESTLVELHRAFGTDYKTIGACQLKFRELLEKSHGRLHGTVKLIGKVWYL